MRFAFNGRATRNFLALLCLMEFGSGVKITASDRSTPASSRQGIETVEDLICYLDEIVEPTVSDFEANPTSVRHAFLACVATFHSVDYLAHPRKPASLRQKFADQSPDFAMVDRVAHALKHVISGNAASPQRQPLRSADIIARPPATAGELRARVSRAGDAVGGVTVDAQTDIDLIEVVKRAIKFLRTQGK
jgi:hypothetical protein